MKAKVAVATVNGKAYFFIVNELKRRGIPFMSILPDEVVPAEIKVVITTPDEKPVITHSKVLIYEGETDPETFGSEVVKALLGKDYYEHIIIGVDPGEVFGLAAIADRQVIDSRNLYNPREVLSQIQTILKTVDFSITGVTVKIGSGVPVYRSLLRLLEQKLPSCVSLEIVEEAGTHSRPKGAKNIRDFRHIISATLIARRPGYVFERRKSAEENC